MDFGKIETIEIDHTMRTAYLDYAMSVIVARALPDARDGLKPVHRRILYGMQGLSLHSNTAHKKSARIVGEVLGKYHPHGDASVYDAMARLAQDFSMRYTLVDGQGNFGSVDGDSPAAMRYTEARLTSRAEELLADLEKDTVDFTDNFDGSLQEPVVLPARLPNLLMNGSSGIAVGMATNIPPHNLRELTAALTYLIDHYDEQDEITFEKLMEFVPGPDFPTGGEIIGREGIRQAYSTGRGRLIVRGKAKIEERSNGRFVIDITEIPYQVNKASLVERMAELVNTGKIDGISDLRDESDRKGMSIIVEIKRGAQPRRVLNQLFKYTALQSTFGVQMLALVNNEPRLLPLKRALLIFLDHRQDVITRRSRYELDKARSRAHILDGLLIALNNLDAVIETIRSSPDVDQARERLVSRFNLTEVQAQAILDLQLRRLAALERQKIEDEHTEILNRIAYLEDLLANPHKILEVIKTDLVEMNEKYGDARRTTITAEATEELKEEDLIADEPVLITITTRGYIKRMAVKTFRAMGRGRRGVSGQTMREEDEVLFVLPGRTLQTVLFFSDKGKVYSEKAYLLPEAGRTDRGVPLINILALDANERITAAVAVPDFAASSYCTLATMKGRVKRVKLDEFASVRPSGLIAMSIENGDQLCWVRLTGGKDDIIMVSAGGMALRMHEDEVRVMGRQASGVAGMKLRKGDQLASMEVIEPDGALLVVTENGFGKRTLLSNYPPRGRATNGIATLDIKALTRTGKVAAARVVQPTDEVTLISNEGVVLRLKVKDIPVSGRATRGVHLMDINAPAIVASIARIPAEDKAAPAKDQPALVLIDEPEEIIEQEEINEPEPGTDEDNLEEG